jgi:hypothetical protein
MNTPIAIMNIAGFGTRAGAEHARVGMLHSVGHIALVCLIVLALLAFRLVWGVPSWEIMRRNLPKGWRRWLSGDPQSPSTKPH